MKIQQLSLFVENRPGALRPPCKTLADAGVDLLSLTVADTEEFGILRLIASDSEKARAVLTAAGFMVKLTEVVAIQVPQRPGGLLAVLDALDQAAQAIEYMYAFAGITSAGRGNGQAVLIFRFADPDAAIAALAKAGISAVAPTELAGR
jgi:hypothetical protein